MADFDFNEFDNLEPIPGRQPESQAAAESLSPEELARQTKLVLDAIKAQPMTDDGGAHCAEVELITGLPHQSASARMTWLKSKGLIVDRDDSEVPGEKIRRLTPSGRWARVWWPATAAQGEG